jgi:hydrogenase/urease accessory protein HupE
MTRASKLLAALAVLVLALTVSPPARAHSVGLSNGEYAIDGRAVVGRLVFSRAELETVAPGLEAAAIEQRLVAKIAVTSGGAACSAGPLAIDHVENDGVALKVRWTCPSPPSRVTVDLPMLAELPSGHRHVVRAFGEPVVDRVCHRNDARFDFATAAAAGPTPAAAASPSALTFVTMGIEHILTGYDHLVFLFGLIVIGGRPRDIVATITAFTVAHSITLGLAALGAWAPSPRIVEPLIALSIVYVGVENFFVKSAKGRWRVTLPFGLVHGFGFAGALREIDLPRAKVPGALVTFNLGVEVGQLLVVSLALGAWALARSERWAPVPALVVRRVRAAFEANPRYGRYGVRALSGAVVVAGALWFVQRVVWP